MVLREIDKNTHIGSIIKAKLNKSNISYKDFAAAIHCDRTNLYHIFKCKSIDTEKLILISKTLGCDLLKEIYYEKEKKEHDTITVKIPKSQFNSKAVFLEIKFE